MAPVAVEKDDTEVADTDSGRGPSEPIVYEPPPSEVDEQYQSDSESAFLDLCEKELFSA